MNATSPSTVTAAILVIGDEILSGRTKDKNIGYIAEYLTQLGVDLREVRVVPDIEDEIVAAVNALRERYDYLFTTGGIGPTHDDITADAIAKAFGVSIDFDPRAVAILRERFAEHELTPARMRMTRIPAGADLVENKISKAPGFRIGNTFVMAGVPAIMQGMLDGIAPTLRTGIKLVVETVEASGVPEGRYGDPLGLIAKEYPDLSIGSYPSFSAGGFKNQIVIRGKEAAEVARARAAVEAMLVSLSA